MYGTLLPRRAEQLKQEMALLIQRCMLGYKARRVVLREKAEKQAEEVFQYWHKIDLIMKGNLQRRIRRAWKARQARVEEKKRKAAELKAAQKPKRFGRAAVARPAAATMTPTKVAAPSPAKKDPALSKTMTLGNGATNAADAAKELGANPDLQKFASQPTPAPGAPAEANEANPVDDVNMFTQNQDILSAEELPPIDEDGEGVDPGASDTAHQTQLKAQDSKDGGAEAASSAVQLVSESQTELEQKKDAEGDLPDPYQTIGPIDEKSAEAGDDEELERA